MASNTGAAEMTILYEAIFSLMAQSRKSAVEDEKRSENGSLVYFIKRPDGCIKIGYSHDPIQRKSQLQTQYECEMTLLATIKGARIKEREMHEHFASFRVSGEWFEPSDELISFIDKVAVENNIQPSLQFQ